MLITGVLGFKNQVGMGSAFATLTGKTAITHEAIKREQAPKLNLFYPCLSRNAMLFSVDKRLLVHVS